MSDEVREEVAQRWNRLVGAGFARHPEGVHGRDAVDFATSLVKEERARLAEVERERDDAKDALLDAHAGANHQADLVGDALRKLAAAEARAERLEALQAAGLEWRAASREMIREHRDQVHARRRFADAVTGLVAAIDAAALDASPPEPATLRPLVLPVEVGDPAERLICLLCHKPNDDVARDGSVGCEYEVRFLTMSGSATAGLHRRCYERAAKSTPEQREQHLRSLGYEPVEPSDVPGMVRGATEPTEPAKGEGEEPGTVVGPYHAHLDVCEQCREHPFALCSTGDRLLRETVERGLKP